MKSSIKDQIRQEIVRRKKICEEVFERESDTYYQGKAVAYGELLPFIDSLPEETCKENTDSFTSLEDAANEYGRENVHYWYDEEIGDGAIYDDFEDLKVGFIAGANWIRKKDVEDMYLSDNRHFLKCYEQGKVDMRVEMMKDAVEGEIGYWNQRGLSIRLDKSLERLGYDMDTKAKIIIVKQDD